MDYYRYTKEDTATLQRVADQSLGKILNYFNVSLNSDSTSLYGPCFIHNGNPCSLRIYLNHDTGVPRWVCFSNMCHEQYCNTSLGLIRACLSVRAGLDTLFGEKVPFWQVLDFVRNELADPSLNLAPKPVAPIVSPYKNALEIPKVEVAKRLKIPSKYFMERGFSAGVLKKYEVGPSIVPQKKTYFREIVPVYDPNGLICIGCTARTIWPQCEKCHVYHDPTRNCPESQYSQWYEKWKNVGFKSKHSLYNYWYLQSKCPSVIIVEGPGNVWRLVEAGIDNAVAMYGSRKLSEFQLKLLADKGIKKLWFAFDNDKAGNTAFQENVKSLWSSFDIGKIEIPGVFNDLAEMDPEIVIRKILPQLV